MISNLFSALVSCLLFNTVYADGSYLVDTSFGPVEGYQMTWTDGSKFDAWQGIPFAQPPVGDLRWRSPRAPTPWTETLDTKALKTQCVQNGGDGDEDCLYLNVYRTGNPSNEGPYPVLFYIYGGSLMSGAANNDFGAFVSHAGNGEGIVVVEVAYRLNIIGFLAAAELSEEQGGVSGNYGIQDQILALQWVKDNVAKFGGDPNKVTISGQSSGGTSVFAILASPSSKGLFHRAISLSGSPNITLSMAAAEVQNAHMITESGCKPSASTTSSEVMACLRGKSTRDLVKLIPLAWSTPGLFGLPLTPEGEHWEGLVIVDGVTITHPFDESLALGSVTSNVPFMIGAMGQECDWGPERDVERMDAEKWEDYLVEYFAPWDTKLRNEKGSKALELIAKGQRSKFNTSQVQTVGEAIYQLYLEDYTADQNPQKAYDSIVSDYGQNCANVRVARSALGGAYSAPIYHFVNQHHLSQQLGGPRPKYTINYAFHVLDFLMALEQWSAFDYDGVTYVPDQRDLEGAQLIQSLWYSFMVTGNPSAGVNNVYPGVLPEWKAFSDTPDWPASYNSYVIQNDEGATTGTVVNYQHEKCDYFEAIGMSDKEFWWCN